MSLALKPYPGYKDSGAPWLGTVPARWPILPAFAVFRERQESNKGLKEKQVLSLSYGRIVKKHEDALHGLVPASFETYQVVEPGDVILRLTDLQNDQRSLRVGFAKDRGIITSAYVCLSVRGHLLPEFAYYLLHAADVQKVFYGMGAGLRQSIGFADLRRLPVVAPDENEQKRIVSFLNAFGNRTEKLIHARRQIIGLLNEQRRVVIHEAVTEGVSPNSIAVTCSEWYPRVPKGWEVVPLRRVIAQAIDGPHFSPTYVESGIPFISARNIKIDCWSLSDAKFITEEGYREFSRRVVPERGDVLYTKGGTTGVARAVDLDFPFQVWVHVAVLKPRRNKITPEYLALVLNSPKCYEQSQLFTRGATNQDLGLNRMKNIVLPLPPTLSEQEEVVVHTNRRLQFLRKAIEDTEKAIALLREYRTRLIADVVTGKLDVREADVPHFDAAEPEPLADEKAESEVEELVGIEEGEDAAN